MIEAVIFDMDGVLIDSEPLYHQAYNSFFKPFGVELDDETYSSFIGKADKSWLEKIIKEKKLPVTVDQVLAGRREEYKRLLGQNLSPIDGVKDLIALFQGKGLKLGLATSSSGLTMELILKGLGLEEAFRSKLNASLVKRAKPDPELYLSSANNLGVEPEKCLAIEDSQPGLASAKAAGMKCVVLLSRYSRNKDFSPADLVVESFAELTPEKLRGLGLP